MVKSNSSQEGQGQSNADASEKNSTSTGKANAKDNYEEFMASGDVPAQGDLRSSEARTSGEAEIAPAEHRSVSSQDQATESAAQDTHPHPTSSSADNSPSNSRQLDSSSTQASAFFSGLFRKATTAIESTIESAKRDFSANEVVSNVQESLNEIGNVMVGSSSRQQRSSPALSRSNSDTLSKKTIALRTLRVNSITGADPLMMFQVSSTGDLVVVTETSIEAFDHEGSKILQSNLEVTWSGDSGRQNSPRRHSEATARSSPTLSSPRGGRMHARAASDVIKATSAVYVPSTDDAVVAHADGALRIYSLRSGQMGVLIREGASFDSSVTCMTTVPSKPSRIFVGHSDGKLRLISVSELRSIGTIEPPEMCSTPLAVGTKNDPVSCIAAVWTNEEKPGTVQGASSSNDAADSVAAAVVGYAGGTVIMTAFNDEPAYPSIAAQANKVSGVTSFYDGVLVVSIGNAEDKSIVATEARTGRCLVRRIVPYTPTCVSRIPQTHAARRFPEAACPSENAFIVGGDEGEVDLFRLTVNSPQNVEIRLTRRISEHTRGRKRTVLQTMYSPTDAILTALIRNGEIRRWKLSSLDAMTLSLSEAELSSVRCTARNVSTCLSDAPEENEDTRLAGVEGVIAAQRVLAAVLEDNVGLDEPGKDALVEEFQKKQAEMQETASQADSELRRAKRRIATRYAHGLEPLPPASSWATRRLAIAARRTASLELELAIRRHADSLLDIRASTVGRLRVVLLDSLRCATGPPEVVDSIRQAAENLTRPPEERNGSSL